MAARAVEAEPVATGMSLLAIRERPTSAPPDGCLSPRSSRAGPREPVKLPPSLYVTKSPVGGADDVGNLIGQSVDGHVGRRAGQLVCQGRAVAHHIGLGHLVPNREDELAPPGDLAGHEAVQLVVRPALREERRGQDDDAEPAGEEAAVDLAAQAVPDAQLKFVVPDLEAALAERVRQRPDDGVLVLAGVADEDVERSSWRRRNSTPVYPIKTDPPPISPVVHRLRSGSVDGRQHS